ncbi:MAG TPA: YdeI/OmpD-associated family protein [Fluviicola sp.]|nr:YdeI/OmpD-associated family protein [Fluviicola sp.]
MPEKEPETFYPKSPEEWRSWLSEHHASKQSIWVIYYKKNSGFPSMSWSEAVDEALCFGWIDSTRRTLDEQRFVQFFTKRKPKSNWSKINKAKIEELIANGKMAAAGLKSIEIAKQNGSWSVLDEVEELSIPGDLQQEFDSNPAAGAFFLGLSKSMRKQLLYWIISAKRPETRQKRVSEIVENAKQGLKPKQFG